MIVSESRDWHSTKKNRITWLAPRHALPSNILWLALITLVGPAMPRHKKISVLFKKKILLFFWLSKFVLNFFCFYIILLISMWMYMWISFVFWQYIYTTCLQKKKILQLWTIRTFNKTHFSYASIILIFFFSHLHLTDNRSLTYQPHQGYWYFFW